MTQLWLIISSLDLIIVYKNINILNKLRIAVYKTVTIPGLFLNVFCGSNIC